MSEDALLGILLVWLSTLTAVIVLCIWCLKQDSE